MSALVNDTIVMIITMAGLSWTRGHTGLWNMIWDQGVLYFVTAVIANLIPAVVLMVDLNPVMNIMFSIPASVTTATVSTRCFVRLSEYTSRDASTPSGILYVDMTLHSFIDLPLCRASLNGAKPWTKGAAGPTTPGAGIMHQPAQSMSIQFARQGEGHPHDGVVDISASAGSDRESPTDTVRGSPDRSPSHFAPYSFNDGKFGKQSSPKEPKDFV